MDDRLLIKCFAIILGICLYKNLSKYTFQQKGEKILHLQNNYK